MKGAVAGFFFAATVVFCVAIFCAALLRFGWTIFIRPIFYAAGWVRPTAHDLEVEGWKAERIGDTEFAVSRYVEALRLDPAREAVRTRLLELGADPDLIAPDPGPKELVATVPDSEPVLPGEYAPFVATPTAAEPPTAVREPEPYPPGWDARRVFGFVVPRLESGVTRDAIVEELARDGFTPENAASAVTTAAQTRVAVLHAAGRKNMRSGALLAGGGLLVTIVTFQLAESTGFIVLAWGAILGGTIQFFRGTIQRSA